MSNATNVIPIKMRKHLIKVGNDFMASSVGIYDVADVIHVIEDAARSFDADTLIKETAKAIGQSVIRSRSTPHLTDNEDWIGYGELVIKLPDTKLVNVRYAGHDALDIRKTNVIENRDQIVRAADLEIQRIDRIQSTMIKMSVDVAGPALDVLVAMRKAA